MLTPEDPLIRELRRRGYKFAAHAYLHPRREGMRILYTAHHPETGQKIDARAHDSFHDALEELRDRCELAGIVPEGSNTHRG